MVFFVVIPVIFGAFGNFLLPTQLGIRDVAFPRLNSFMFWVTPAGFVMLLHILLFDRAYNVTYWVNYSELRARLRRRFTAVEAPLTEYHMQALNQTALGMRLSLESPNLQLSRGRLLQQHAPQLTSRSFDVLEDGAASIKNMCLVPMAEVGAFAHGFIKGAACVLTTLIEGLSALFFQG